MPFLSDEIYRNLTEEDSVHLTDWPEVKTEWINHGLNEEVALTRTIVNLGHATRGKKKIRVRQPLSKVTVGLPQSVSHEVIRSQEAVILEELNVKSLELLEDAGELAEFTAMPKAKLLGPKYGKDVQQIIQQAKAGDFTVLDSGQVQVGNFTLEPEEVELAYKGKEGVELEAQDGIVGSLDLEVTEALMREGLMREVVRQLQDMRKEANYQVSDRILVKVESSGDLEAAVTEFANVIQAETLANELIQDGELDADLEKDFEIEGFAVKLAIKRA